MKRFPLFQTLISAAGLLCLAGHAPAQIPGGTPAGMSMAMMKLFGEHPAFTADVEASVTSPSHQPLKLTMTMTCLEHKMRSEVNMNKMSGGGVPAQTVAQLKQLGMDRVVSVIQPDKKTITLIYPNLRAYAELPLADQAKGIAAKKPEMRKTALGKETVQGHPCVKSRVTFIGNKNQKQEILVWSATDLKNFPVKMQMDAAGGEVIMLYTHVRFIKPDARQFEPPSGYTRYSNQMQIMQKAAQRMAGGKPDAIPKR